MSEFRIVGRRAVGGTHRVPGNKNAALPMIAAALLTADEVVLENVPDIADVARMLDCADHFGVRVVRDPAARTVALRAAGLRHARLDPALAGLIRTSALYAGPLLARLGRVHLPSPGGDGIGQRRLDAHFAGFVALGAKVAGSRRGFTLRADGRLTGARIILDEASVTATENVLMAAVLAKGVSEIYNAACEPHVQNLCRMLASMGAKISGVGTNRLLVEGVDELRGARVRVGCDVIEAVSYLAAAAMTGGGLLLEDVDVGDFEIVARKLARFGVRWQSNPDARTVWVPPRQRLKLEYDFGDAIPVLADGPWPMFPSDLMSVLIVLATQTRGTCLFHEKMFESRMYFVDHLIGMGAKIVPCDPHRVVVTGPTQLVAGTMTSPDIRAGMALILAALCARGETRILNAESIDRGYEQIERRLAELGAEIRRT